MRHFNDWLSHYLQFTHNSEPPEIYKKWVGISTLAACLQRKCYLSWGSEFYPNFYIALVGPPGTRKGTAMNPGLSLLNSVGVKVAADTSSRQYLIQRFCDATAQETMPDGSIYIHSSITAVCMELAVFLGFNNAEFMINLNDYYDCRDRWEYGTVSRQTESIVGVFLNLIGGITPDLIQASIPRSAVGAGLTSRMILVYADRKGKTVPVPILTNEELKIRKLLEEDLQKILMMKGPFSVEEKWLDCYISWYSSPTEYLKFHNNEFMARYFERRQTHLIKLCMICSASRSDEMILTKKDFDAALLILTETEESMPKAFLGIGKSILADVTTRVMTTISIHKEIRFSELLSMFYHDADKETLSRILATLKSMNFCDITWETKDAIIKYLKGKV